VGIISVQSPTTGSSYSVRIAGDVPTAEEQQRIDAYLAQQDAAFARTASQLFPSVSAPAPEAPVEEDDWHCLWSRFRRVHSEHDRSLGIVEEAACRCLVSVVCAENLRAWQEAAEKQSFASWSYQKTASIRL
jgi:hypothetical protein